MVALGAAQVQRQVIVKAGRVQLVAAQNVDVIVLAEQRPASVPRVCWSGTEGTFHI